MRSPKPWLAALATLGFTLPTWGQAAGESDPEDNLTSLSYISYLERYATIFPAAQSESLDAAVNMPVLPGDRVETSRSSRVEMQLADGNTVWLDEFTTLDVDSVARSRGSSAKRTSLYLGTGSLAVEVTANSPSLRLDSKAGTVFLTSKGLYRLTARDGQLQVATFQGVAELPAGMGSVILRSGFVAWIAHGEEVSRASWNGSGDDFWQWVLERRSPPSASVTATHLSVPKAYVLDSYGEWVYVDDLGSYGWRPRVSFTWVPYSYGRWYWTPTGWCWVSYEPWGWYPYHYGSWYFSVSVGWVWFWDEVWAPAWVHWLYTPGYVGWCPRGYYDWWWWRHCSTCTHMPHRWNEVTFSFFGRVRFEDVDPRPWTLVSEDRFTHSRIDQVRLDPERLFRERAPQREGYVRSGPLLEAPDSDGTVKFRKVFVDQEITRGGEIGRFLGRQPISPKSDLPPVHRTAEVNKHVRPHLPPRSDDHLNLPPRQSAESRNGRPQPGPSQPPQHHEGRGNSGTPGRDNPLVPPRQANPERPTVRRPSSWERGSEEAGQPHVVRRPLSRHSPAENNEDSTSPLPPQRRPSRNVDATPPEQEAPRFVPRYSSPPPSLPRPTYEPRSIAHPVEPADEAHPSPRSAPPRIAPPTWSSVPTTRVPRSPGKPTSTSAPRPSNTSSSRASASSSPPQPRRAATPRPKTPQH